MCELLGAASVEICHGLERAGGTHGAADGETVIPAGQTVFRILASVLSGTVVMRGITSGY